MSTYDHVCVHALRTPTQTFQREKEILLVGEMHSLQVNYLHTKARDLLLKRNETRKTSNQLPVSRYREQATSVQGELKAGETCAVNSDNSSEGSTTLVTLASGNIASRSRNTTME